MFEIEIYENENEINKKKKNDYNNDICLLPSMPENKKCSARSHVYTQALSLTSGIQLIN